jgi:hypothetical protein
MIYTIFITFGTVILLVFLLTKLSPYDVNHTDFVDNSFVFNDNNTSNIKYVEIEKVVEKPVEVIVEKEIEKLVDNPELLEKIKQLEEELQNEKSKPLIDSKIYRNIGLELYQEKDLHRLSNLLKETINKKVLIVTDSSFVLGANFSDHRVYEGSVVKYDVITDRYPNQPIIRFYINVPVLSTTNVQLNWVFDNQKFDSDFSSSKLVSDFLKTKEPKNELFLLEV